MFDHRKTSTESEETYQGRQRKRRSDVGPRITERDLAALRWIAQQYAIRLDHLQILLARLLPARERVKLKTAGRLTARRAQDVVDRWTELGLVRVRYFLAGEPPWCWLTGAGLHLLQMQPELRAYEPKPATLAHLHACNRVRLAYPQLSQAYRQAGETTSWRGEREIRAAQEPLKRGQKPPHVPDALVTSSTRGAIVIEVELTMKTYARLRGILIDLAGNQSYQAIWYFATLKIKQAIEHVVREKEFPDVLRRKFIVYDLDQLD